MKLIYCIDNLYKSFICEHKICRKSDIAKKIYRLILRVSDEVNRTRIVKTALLIWSFSMSTNFAWVILSIAGIFEVCWAIGLKYTDGFTKLGPSLFTLICLSASMFLLAKASQVLPIGTAYAIWVGIGALGASLVGIFLLKEPVSATRIMFLFLLLVSIIGLKLSTK